MYVYIYTCIYIHVDWCCTFLLICHCQAFLACVNLHISERVVQSLSFGKDLVRSHFGSSLFEASEQVSANKTFWGVLGLVCKVKA